jgi:hypothetical protein
MSITREQVAGLRLGDVVEIRDERYPAAVVRGPISRVDEEAVAFGDWTFFSEEAMTLTVIERAPRPLYVNHDRTEPLPGDVIRASDGTPSLAFRTSGEWIWPNGTRARPGEPPYTLLVDGYAGDVVIP